MEEQIVKEYIERANRWWSKSHNIPQYKDRKIYNEIEKFMKTRQIIAITGLRRVGKTTFMKKAIKDNLGNKFPEKNIFYFSFDEFSDIRLIDLIKLYEKIMGKKIEKEKFLIFFDEIQKVKNWSEQLKAMYDLYPNIKVIISGSESLFIRKKSRESLAGRIYEFRITPLSFKEYLEFKEIKIDNLWLQRETITREFKAYLLNNGFPEVLHENEEITQKYIREGILDKILYRDLSEVFEVKNVPLIKSLFEIIYNNPGQMIELQELAGELNASRQMISEYMGYLEDSFLIKKLYNYSRNARKTQRKLKKYYATLINPLLIKTEFSKIFEQAMVIQLNADFFWRDSYKNEVDIIKMDPLTAIEIKSGEIKERDLSSLQAFIKKFNPEKAMVLSYDKSKKIDKVNILPFYEYLLKN